MDWKNRSWKSTQIDSQSKWSVSSRTFFNALRQKYGRGLACPIDELKLVSSFERKSLGSKMAIKLEGIYLQGAGFEGGGIVDQFSKNLSEFIPLPIFNIA